MDEIERVIAEGLRLQGKDLPVSSQHATEGPPDKSGSEPEN